VDEAVVGGRAGGGVGGGAGGGGTGGGEGGGRGVEEGGRAEVVVWEHGGGAGGGHGGWQGGYEGRGMGTCGGLAGWLRRGSGRGASQPSAPVLPVALARPRYVRLALASHRRLLLEGPSSWSCSTNPSNMSRPY
jgi:hypothetical protein